MFKTWIVYTMIQKTEVWLNIYARIVRAQKTPFFRGLNLK